MTEEENRKIKAIDLKTFLTLLPVFVILAGGVGGYFIQGYRVGENAEDVKATLALAKSNQALLAQPRFTLEDYTRMESSKAASNQKELDRRAVWMQSQDEFRRKAEQAIISTSKDVESIKGLVSELKDEFKKSKQ